jgi:hypothetical protein
MHHILATSTEADRRNMRTCRPFSPVISSSVVVYK